jgi:glycosyl transferase family 25
MITTYVINLKKDIERRNYMVTLLKPYTFLDIEFIDAVNGKELSENEIREFFDEQLAYKRYGRKLNRGEIGCTLSHYKCYQKLLDSSKDFALILEDDISIIGDLHLIEVFHKYMNTHKPCVCFLSGDYWWTKQMGINDNYKICNIYDAVGGYAYIINRAAAKLLMYINKRPGCLADSWYLTKSQGVSLYAIKPYIIDANIENFESTINQSYFGENRKNMSSVFRIKAYWNAFIKKVLLKQGKFVSKIRGRRLKE